MYAVSALLGSGFMPQGDCYSWHPDILWLNVGSDALIALAFYSIPLALFSAIRHRPGLRFGWLLWSFGAVMFLSGTTHLVEIWTVWDGVYGIEGVVKGLTATVSVAAAIALWPALTKALALPSAKQLETSNAELRREIGERQRAEAELRRTQSELEDRVRGRTAELENANRSLERGIAERRRAEEHFRRAVESSPAGMLMVDSKGVIVLANRAVESIFGYPEHELIGRPIELVVPERFRAEHASQREAFLREPTTRVMGAGRDLFGRRVDGSEVPNEIGLNPIQTDEGTFVLSSIVDITERKHAEETIRAKHEELERSLRDLDEFAHVVSHDLKAPLRGIVSLSSWIREDCAERLPPEAREHLELLEERTGRMSELIDGILRYSRVRRNPARPQQIDTGELLREVIDSLDPPDGIRVGVEGTPPTVSYDRTQLRQVFQNLVGNAIQHLGKPTGEVVVSCHEEASAFVFAVRDDGPGIDERHHERIFRIFQSLDPDRVGTGVGLAIVKKVVERNGGSIRLESKPGAGATFQFTVPKGRRPAVGGPSERS